MTTEETTTDCTASRSTVWLANMDGSEKMEEEKTAIYRLKFVSRINSKWLRRLAILLTFPLLFVLNCAIATVTITAFVIVHWWKTNRELFKSAALRWNERLDDGR